MACRSPIPDQPRPGQESVRALRLARRACAREDERRVAGFAGRRRGAERADADDRASARASANKGARHDAGEPGWPHHAARLAAFIRRCKAGLPEIAAGTRRPHLGNFLDRQAPFILLESLTREFGRRVRRTRLMTRSKSPGHAVFVSQAAFVIGFVPWMPRPL